MEYFQKVVCNYFHGGESQDFKTTTMADTIEKASIQVRLFFIFPLILIRLTWGLMQIRAIIKAACPLYATFRQRSG